jgi:hypothetical protein
MRIDVVTFRPVNTMLYSAKEKADLANLVRIHIAYNITYAQQRNTEGQVAFYQCWGSVSFLSVSGTSDPNL